MLARRWKVLIVTSVAVFMAFLDVTIVNIAFPDLRRSFPDDSLGDLSWVLNGYNVVFAATLVPAGRLADRLRRKRFFLAGVLIFLAELDLFRVRSFTVANAGLFVFAIGFFALLLYNVLFLTTAWHYSVLGAGSALTPRPGDIVTAFHNCWAMVAGAGLASAVIVVALGRVRARQVDHVEHVMRARPVPATDASEPQEAV